MHADFSIMLKIFVEIYILRERYCHSRTITLILIVLNCMWFTTQFHPCLQGSVHIGLPRDIQTLRKILLTHNQRFPNKQNSQN